MPAAWAQACPGVCIGFAPVASNVQAVPLSPEAMGLLAVMMAVAAYWALRRKSRGLVGLLLTAAAGTTGMVLEMRQAQAAATYTVVLTAGSNSASVAIPDAANGSVNVQNTLSTTVTITSITAKATLSMAPSSPLKVGSTLAAGATASGAIFVCNPGQVYDPVLGGCI